jgi:endoglucanase
MLAQSTLDFLARLLDTPGPSGFEGAAARVWRDEARTFTNDVSGDVHGNSMAVANPNGQPTIMLAGHIDEIGLIVQYIDDNGYVYIAPIGGWDAQVLVGQRIRFIGATGDVYGVIGKKPIHLIKPEERKKAVEISDLWVDIGVTSRDAAKEMLRVGDAGVIDTRVLHLPNNRIASRSIDDRIGAFVVLEALRRYAAKPGAARVVAVATTQEEIGYLGGGAFPGANRVNPSMAIAVDVTFATDSPGIDKKEVGDCALGGGPVLARGSVISPVVFGLLSKTAQRLNMPHAVRAVGRNTSTDADAIHIAREGIATALLGIPNRYMHSPNEIVCLDDVDRAADLIAETCRAVTTDTDFTAR